MLCLNCKRENEPTARFCIFCGSPLPGTQAESPQEQSPAIEDELRSLREMVAQVSDRLEECVEAKLSNTRVTIHIEPCSGECKECTASCTLRDKNG